MKRDLGELAPPTLRSYTRCVHSMMIDILSPSSAELRKSVRWSDSRQAVKKKNELAACRKLINNEPDS